MSDLLAALREFDGKAVTILSQARAQFGDSDNFLSTLAKLIDSPEPYVADGATWLIKDCVEKGHTLKSKEVEGLGARLDGVPTWPAALHLLQIAEYLDLTPDQAQRFGEWAAGYLDHNRPFLRAWSMSALQHCARHAPELVPLAEEALVHAEQDTSASVRARARKFGARS